MLLMKILCEVKNFYNKVFYNEKMILLICKLEDFYIKGV